MKNNKFVLEVLFVCTLDSILGCMCGFSDTFQQLFVCGLSVELLTLLTVFSFKHVWSFMLCLWFSGASQELVVSSVDLLLVFSI